MASLSSAPDEPMPLDLEQRATRYREVPRGRCHSVVWTPSGWQWLPVVVGALVVYELLRAAFTGWLRHRYEAHVDRFLRQNDIPTDAFRHIHRVVVKERVMDDPGLRAAIDERAASTGLTVHEVEQQVRAWLDEVVPQFNLLAYYKIGYRIGRIAAYATYNVRLDKASLQEAQARIPADASVVYVSNHRSNADFVVTGFMLSKSVQVSYAVGEWARVWPLDKLFRAFGSYFVRRGEKDPLYHRTLEAYLQLITKQGVTQAMFPEGGLSRDGRLRPAKLGLLDYMARCTLDPSFTRPLVFVPVGINFDRVLEDENLVREARGERPKRRGAIAKAARVLIGLPRLLWLTAANTARFLSKRLKKHGVAAIHFGEPVVFQEWAAKHHPTLDDPDRHARHESLRPFGDLLLRCIGAVIPLTPVSLACAAMARLGQERMEHGVDRGTLLLTMRTVHDAASAAGIPMAIGDPYEHTDRAFRRTEAMEVSADIDTAERVERALDYALDVTRRRRILFREAGSFRTQRWDLVEYYANSVRPHMVARTRPPPQQTA